MADARTFDELEAALRAGMEALHELRRREGLPRGSDDLGIPAEPDRLLELGTAARMLRMTRQGARKAIMREGVGQKICGKWVVARSDVERLMRAEQPSEFPELPRQFPKLPRG